MINAYWEPLEFDVQEGTAPEWVRVIDTSLESPNEFPDRGVPLAKTSYSVGPRSVVDLLRSRNNAV